MANRSSLTASSAASAALAAVSDLGFLGRAWASRRLPSAPSLCLGDYRIDPAREWFSRPAECLAARSGNAASTSKSARRNLVVAAAVEQGPIVELDSKHVACRQAFGHPSRQ